MLRVEYSGKTKSMGLLPDTQDCGLHVRDACVVMHAGIAN